MTRPTMSIHLNDFAKRLVGETGGEASHHLCGLAEKYEYGAELFASVAEGLRRSFLYRRPPYRGEVLPGLHNYRAALDFRVKALVLATNRLKSVIGRDTPEGELVSAFATWGSCVRPLMPLLNEAQHCVDLIVFARARDAESRKELVLLAGLDDVNLLDPQSTPGSIPAHEDFRYADDRLRDAKQYVNREYRQLRAGEVTQFAALLNDAFFLDARAVIAASKSGSACGSTYTGLTNSTN